MIQCVRQGYDTGVFLNTDPFYNFLKYLVSFGVALTSYLSKFHEEFFFIWMLTALVACSYSYYWDVKKDWQFLQKYSKYRLLRAQLAYDSPNLYYSILIVNGILR